MPTQTTKRKKSRNNGRKTAANASRKKQTPKKVEKNSQQQTRVPRIHQFPDFYERRHQVLPEETGDLFVGRKIQLESLWNILAESASQKSMGWAYMAQKKTGKTALLKRFYNIVFWEQDAVVPLYYCFDDREKVASVVADELAITFLAQWTSFIRKDPEIIFTIFDEHSLYAYAEQDNELRLRLITAWEKYCRAKAKKPCTEDTIAAALDVLNTLTIQSRQRCMVILDEAQELVRSILDDTTRKPVRCERTISTIKSNAQLLLLLSGSKVSMLHYDILKGIANRILSRDLLPMKEQDVAELVQRLIKHEGYGAYEGIAKDVYELVGGNPFYIRALLSSATHYRDFHVKDKSFHNRGELQEVFMFETTHRKGIMLDFWDNHFHENAELLNSNPVNRPGLTYEILKYIADRPDDLILYTELAEKFQIDMDEVEKRIERLKRADLLRMTVYGEVRGFEDRILPLAVRKIFYQRMHPGADVAIIQNEIEAIVAARLNKFENRMRGIMNNFQGDQQEQTILKKIEADGGRFCDRQWGDLNKIRLPGGKFQGYELDIFGWEQGNGKTALIGEVKSSGKKVYISEADKFIKVIAAAKKHKKANKVVAVFISNGEFSVNARQCLEQAGVVIGKPADFGL